MSLAKQEIGQQPDVVARLLERQGRAIDALAAEVRRQSPRYAVLAARGTSDNAARYTQHALGRILRLPVALATPSLHTIYDAPPRFDDALVIGISQSGASPDVVSVVAEPARQGALTAAITNDPSSPLAGAAEHVIDLGAGEERSVAATKTYTAELAAIAALVASGDPDLSYCPGHASPPAVRGNRPPGAHRAPAYAWARCSRGPLWARMSARTSRPDARR